MHLPKWQVYGLFYPLIALSLGGMLWKVYRRSRLWMGGRPIEWKPALADNVWAFVLGQRKVAASRPRSGAPMHLLIFYGFVSLVLATTLLGIAEWGPVWFHKGAYYLAYEMVFDLTGLLLLVGLIWALVRRGLFRPSVISHHWTDFWTLGVLLVLTLTGYVLEAARMANSPQPWDTSAPVGYAVSRMMGEVSDGAYVGIWWFHMVWVALFFWLLPDMRIRHILLGTLSAAGKPDHPMGRLRPISMEEVEQTEKIGAEVASDLSRWHLLSTDACMECGRCTEVCPAFGVGKSLNPKEIVLGARAAMESGGSLAEKLTPEALWDCTTCNACVEACPVLIRHVDVIVEARRGLVAANQLSGSGATMLRQTASTGHAWGLTAGQREDWMKGQQIPLAREGAEFDVLLWVGCAGASDPGGVRTTRAVASLLKKAGVRFACLGREERCTGDAARRVGEEFLFQEMAQANIATFARYGVQTILTSCPHCFNTLANEYGDFGGRYEVLHHTQYLARLVAEGRLRAASPEPGAVTFHDPCYLARVNGEVDAPRLLLGQASAENGHATPLDRWALREMVPLRLAEPEHRGTKTLCCGAGGGRMWFDEEPGQRPAERRVAELQATGAERIAVACPFCRIMLGASCETPMVDVAELLDEANS